MTIAHSNRGIYHAGIMMTVKEFSQHKKPFYFVVSFLGGVVVALIDPKNNWIIDKAEENYDHVKRPTVYFPINIFQKTSWEFLRN